MSSLNRALFYSKREEELGDELSPRQKAFVDEYLLDLDPKKAGQRAGYQLSAIPALMTMPKIINAIQRATAYRAARTRVEQDHVIFETALVAFSSLAHYSIDDQGNVGLVEGAPAHAMRAVQSIHKRITMTEDARGNVSSVHDVEVKLWDKMSALRLLGKHVGLFPDKVEVTGKDGGPVETVTRVERVIVDPSQTTLTTDVKKHDDTAD